MYAQDQPLQSLPYTPSLETGFMDRSVNPCVDFYKYSCGNWIKQNPPADPAPAGVFYSKLAMDNERYLWGILEASRRNPPPPVLPTSRRSAITLPACMDEQAAEKAGVVSATARIWMRSLP